MLGGSHFFVRTDWFQFLHYVMRTWSVLYFFWGAGETQPGYQDFYFFEIHPVLN
jgi:hypothetical protein